MTLARIVADTADLTARENTGVYQDLARVQLRLPGGWLLDNPSTENPTEPSGATAWSPGQVAYEPQDSGSRGNDTAVITIYTTATDVSQGNYHWWRTASPDDRERVSSYMDR